MIWFIISLTDPNKSVFRVTKKGNTKTNRFGLKKKGEYKYDFIWVDKEGQIQTHIRIF